MKTRRMFLVALCGVAMLIGASSCKKEKQENENGETMTIKASLGSAGNNSKTHLDGGTVKWDPNDAFKLFPAEGTAGTKFSLTRIDGQDGKVAYFEGKHPGDAPYYACYPFNNVSCTAEGTFTFSIPQVQNDSPETVSGNSNAGPMVGYMENASGSLTFQNAMSWLKVGLKGNVVIKRVVLTDNTSSPANNKLNGTLTVTCSVDEGGVFSFTSEMDRNTGTNQLVIVSNDGVQLDGTNPTYFWFQVPAGSLASLNLSAYLDVEGTKNVLNLNKTITHGESVPGIGVNTILTANVNSPVIEGALPGLFTINSNGDQVYFSKGNLQFQTTTKEWKFADDQYDICDKNTSTHITSDYVENSNNWIDLFGWGTSGYNHNDKCYQPWSTTKVYSDYFAYNVNTNNLFDGNGKADWGYNKISNGGNIENSGWRTLTGGDNGEWNYLLNERSMTNNDVPRYTNKTSGITIDDNSYNGLFIYPDDYNGTEVGKDDTTDTWDEIDALGIVFLPAAGNRGVPDGASEVTTVQFVGARGSYWSSSSHEGDFYAEYFDFTSSDCEPKKHTDRYDGFSVRLVMDVPNAFNGGSANDFESDNWQ